MNYTNLIAYSVNEIGNLVAKAKPLTDEVIRQYIAGNKFLAICLLIFSIFLFSFGSFTVHISIKTKEDGIMGVAVFLFLFSFILIGISINYFSNAIAPLPTLLKLF